MRCLVSLSPSHIGYYVHYDATDCHEVKHADRRTRGGRAVPTAVQSLLHGILVESVSNAARRLTRQLGEQWDVGHASAGGPRLVPLT